MVNLGVTFRNSKWSSYARKNVSLQFVHKYLRNLGLILLALLLSVFFNPTNLVDNLWGALDTTLSNVLFGYFFLLAVLHTIVNGVYTIFFTQFQRSNKTSLISRNTLARSEIMSKNSELMLVYSWLQQPTSSKTLENVFSQTSSSSTSKLELTKSLFKLTQPLTLLKAAGKATDGIVLPDSLVTSSTSTFRFPTQSLSLRMHTRVLNGEALSLTTEVPRFKWAIAPVSGVPSTFNPTRYSKLGNFYLPSVTASQLAAASRNYSEMGISSELLANQKALIQRNAWLYKFSTLNRNVLNHSKNITRTKSFLSTTFTPFSLPTKNIWAASEVNLSQQGSALQRSLAANSTSAFPTHSLRLPTTSVSSTTLNSTLRSAELSYLWMIKRLYLFNNLAANQSVSLPTLELNSQKPSLSTFTSPRINLNVLTSYLLQSPQLATDFTSSFTPNLTKISKVASIATPTEPLTLNYVNTGIYTSSFATLATTFESTLAHSDRNNVYSSPLYLPDVTTTGFDTTLLELKGNSTRNEPTFNQANVALTRDLTLLADLRLVHMLF